MEQLCNGIVGSSDQCDLIAGSNVACEDKVMVVTGTTKSECWGILCWMMDDSNLQGIVHQEQVNLGTGIVGHKNVILKGCRCLSTFSGKRGEVVGVFSIENIRLGGK